MLRPHTPLFNTATDEATPEAAAGGGGVTLQARLLEKAAARDPSVAAAVKEWKPAAAAAATEETAEAEKPAEAEEAKPDTTAEAQTDEPEGEEAVEEIAEGDAVDVQLKKLASAQKKSLKRIDKLTQRNKELEAKLQTETPQETAAGTGAVQDALPQVKTHEELEKATLEIENYIEFCRKHMRSGTTIKNAKGEDVEMSPEDLTEELLYFSDVLTKGVPAKREFLNSREKSRTEAGERFKPWQDKASFTAAKAEVETTMKKHQALMPDYELALNERALGRLALSDGWVLMPKSKAAANAGVTSAPVKKAPITPVNPPISGGPPIKPAGTGPDLESMKQQMLKNPGNREIANAYVKATLAAARAARAAS